MNNTTKKRCVESIIAVGCILVIAFLSMSPYAPEKDVELEDWAIKNNISLTYGSSMLSKYVDKQTLKQKILENKVCKIEIGLNYGYSYIIEYRNPMSGFYERYCYYKKPGDV